ncbi:MAG: prepilin-type N-terminal cleavage/methylation domain-containing protein [Syntrophaceae bacterium]|nr:prepilin-type N-terminal cleavage/methylation domain-containing protein [Syntrophaceae bacterium]
MKLLPKKDGFTLVEILIALVILSISLLALAALMATTTQNTSFGGHLTEAATFAQDRLEELRVTPWASIAAGSDVRTSTGTGMSYNRTWTVAETGSLKTVTITVTWNDPLPHLFSLTSSFAQ